MILLTNNFLFDPKMSKSSYSASKNDGFVDNFGDTNTFNETTFERIDINLQLRMRFKGFGSAMKVIMKNWKNNGTLVLENFLNQVFFFATENSSAPRDWHIQQTY